jgi:REP element-mobilizing transposase RayT
MARKVRIEYAGAFYHVLNRGNYRSWIFESEGARKSFLKCLEQCCEAMGWRVHAWVLMGNHYHLCLETPEPNLVDGMKWLQSTFSNRFNRFHKTNGHVFQGRYKAILLDGDAADAVCHYIHLNPVRAGLVDADSLQTYEWGSFSQLWYPRKRWPYLKVNSCLESAGNLKDTPHGRRFYRDYLGWLSEEEPERKRMGFEGMSLGWAKGSKEFKKAVVYDLKDETIRKVVEAEAEEIREPRWERAAALGLEVLGKTEDDLSKCRKGEIWKVALARWLRESHLVPNRWIAGRLKMGTRDAVSSLVSRHRRNRGESYFETLKNHEIVD